MAQAAVMFTRRKLAAKSSIPLGLRPSWYPWDAQKASVFTLDAPDESSDKMIRVVTRIQARFRGYMARKYLAKTTFQSVMLTDNAFRVVGKQVSGYIFGCRKFFIFFLLYIFLLLMAYSQILRTSPKLSEFDASLRLMASTIMTASGKDYTKLTGIDDIQEFLSAGVNALYAGDPLFEKDPSCVLPKNDNCAAARSILLNDTALGDFIVGCGLPSQNAGFVTPDAKSLYWLEIQQTRRAVVPCTTSSISIFDCYSDEYAAEYEAHNVDSNGTITSPTIVTSISAMGEDAFVSDVSRSDGKPWFSFYTPSGFLNIDPELGRCYAQLFFDIGWISRPTREVCLKSVYRNSNQFGIVGILKICFEVSLSGQVSPSIQIESSPMNVNGTNDTIVQFVFTSLFLSFLSLYTLFTMVFTVPKFLKACAHLFYRVFKRHRYQVTKFHRISVTDDFFLAILDFAMIVLQYMSAIGFFMYFDQSSTLFESAINRPEPSNLGEFLDALEELELGYPDVGNMYVTLQYLLSISILLATYRCITMLGFHPETAMITKTVVTCGRELLWFLIVYLAVVSGYSLVMTIRYGTELDDFNTFGKAFNSLLLISLAMYDDVIRLLDNDRPIFDFIVVWTYIVITTILLLNILLSIVVEAFIVFKESRKSNSFVSFEETCLLALQSLRYDVSNMWCRSCGYSYTRCRGRSIEVGKLDDDLSAHVQNVYVQAPAVYAKNAPHTVRGRLKEMMKLCRPSFETYALRTELEQMFSPPLVERIISGIRAVARENHILAPRSIMMRHMQGNHLQVLNLSNQCLSETHAISRNLSKLQSQVETLLHEKNLPHEEEARLL